MSESTTDYVLVTTARLEALEGVVESHWKLRARKH